MILREKKQTALKFVWTRKGHESPRYHNAGFQAVLQSCDHKDKMVLAQKQTHRPMEQNREPRNGPSALWAPNL